MSVRSRAGYEDSITSDVLEQSLGIQAKPIELSDSLSSYIDDDKHEGFLLDELPNQEAFPESSALPLGHGTFKT